MVYRAKDKKTDKIVALKRLKMEREKEGFPITSLREINTLLISQHPNVVTVREIVVGSNMDKIYIGKYVSVSQRALNLLLLKWFNKIFEKMFSLRINLTRIMAHKKLGGKYNT